MKPTVCAVLETVQRFLRSSGSDLVLLIDSAKSSHSVSFYFSASGNYVFFLSSPFTEAKIFITHWQSQV